MFYIFFSCAFENEKYLFCNRIPSTTFIFITILSTISVRYNYRMNILSSILLYKSKGLFSIQLEMFFQRACWKKLQEKRLLLVLFTFILLHKISMKKECAFSLMWSSQLLSCCYAGARSLDICQFFSSGHKNSVLNSFSWWLSYNDHRQKSYDYSTSMKSQNPSLWKNSDNFNIRHRKWKCIPSFEK